MKKNYIRQLNYNIQIIINDINNFKEEKNNLLIKRNSLYSNENISKIAKEKLDLKKIPLENYRFIKIDKN